MQTFLVMSDRLVGLPREGSWYRRPPEDNNHQELCKRPTSTHSFAIWALIPLCLGLHSIQATGKEEAPGKTVHLGV